MNSLPTILILSLSLPTILTALVALIDDCFTYLMRARFGSLSLDCAATFADTSDCDPRIIGKASWGCAGLGSGHVLGWTAAEREAMATESDRLDSVAVRPTVPAPAVALAATNAATPMALADTAPLPVIPMRGVAVRSVRPVGSRSEIVRSVAARAAVEAIVARVERAAERERAALVRAVETMTLRAMGV